jgi:cell wall-associated NlpC family hydrolase
VRFAPFVEAGPRAQVLAQRVEPFLDLGPNGPMTVAAVALIVNGWSLAAAYALLPHVLGTAVGSLRLRLDFLAGRQGRGVPLGGNRLFGLLGGEGREDRLALGVLGLRSDFEQHHPRRLMARGVSADGGNMGQRLAMLAAACAVAVVSAGAAAGSGTQIPNWAKPQIATVVSHKLMGAKSVKKFRPNAVLTRQTLADLAAGLKEQLGSPVPTGSGGSGGTTTTTPTTGTTTTGTTTTTTTVSDPTAPATMAQLDRSLVQAIGLGKAAKQFAQGARDAGLTVPGRFGFEVVARLLGLRLNHPAAQDFLELRPQDPATRAEAAYSAAQILGLGLLDDSWQIAEVKSLAATFALPTLNDWQLQILGVAFSKIGMPYVWGGTSDNTEVDFGVTAPGGYDCSGFVWRVFKLQAYADEGTLASTIEGRTTYAMSVEIPKSKRIPFNKLQPADVVFFGTKGAKSNGPQVFHTGIYVGNGWFIQSSDEGVALAQLSGWYKKKFAWGRRPLHEAGLE